MLTNAHISCIYFFLIGLIVYEIRQVDTLSIFPLHYTLKTNYIYIYILRYIVYYVFNIHKLQEQIF